MSDRRLAAQALQMTSGTIPIDRSVRALVEAAGADSSALAAAEHVLVRQITARGDTVQRRAALVLLHAAGRVASDPSVAVPPPVMSLPGLRSWSAA